MGLIKKPMLAVKAGKLEFPMWATPKIDGIRALKVDGKLVSRSFKLIPNRYIRRVLEGILPEGADGEIVSGGTFSECTSNIMSFEGEPDFHFWWFDYVASDLYKTYEERLEDMGLYPLVDPDEHVRPLYPSKIRNEEELRVYEENVLKMGYEGVILRKADSPYKCGRSTKKEGYLLKIKRFEDSEAEVLGFCEELENKNKLEQDEFGYAKRSNSKAKLKPADTLGAFIVRDVNSGVEFNLPARKNLTHEDRKEIWENKEKYVGKWVKYKFFPIGVKNKPRHPQFLGFRDKKDL